MAAAHGDAAALIKRRSGFFDFVERQRPASPAGDAPLSVVELTRRIDRSIRDGLGGRVRVRGEISNLNRHAPSGHIYFTLKDAEACIDCVMFRSDAARLRFAPEDGLEVVCGGEVKVYPQRGRYQLYAAALEPVGRGALELAFEQLRARLQQEGLFDAARKRPLPRYPARVLLLTSTQTAALQDMLKVLRRFPFVRPLVMHVPVQGEGAGAAIAEALRAASRQARQIAFDVVVLARGGGSLEDLWAFNDEALARAIAGCAVPVVTGIGHEVDVSIADLVADYHAHTPTEAAQVVVSNWRTARDALETLGVRLRRETRRRIEEGRERLRGVARLSVFRRPGERLARLHQRLDEMVAALSMAVLRRGRRSAERVDRAASALLARHPRHRVALARRRLEDLQRRLQSAAQANARRQHARLEAASALLSAVSPESVLRRGFSITLRKRDGRPLRSAADAAPGERILTRLHDGEIESTVEDRRQPGLFE